MVNKCLQHVGFYARAMPGESSCGDACAVWATSERLVIALVDGLGHGEGAAYAAHVALSHIGARLDATCAEIFHACDQGMCHTRGAALALAIIEPALNRLTLATVGNVRAVLFSGDKELHLGGARGIVGAGYDGLAPEVKTLQTGDALLLYSDGLDEFLPLGELLRSNPPPKCIAEQAIARWAKDNDDAAFLVYQHLEMSFEVRK